MNQVQVYCSKNIIMSKNMKRVYDRGKRSSDCKTIIAMYTYVKCVLNSSPSV